MPVYEFLCRDCDTRYDDLVGMDASMDDQQCPGCTSADVVKLYSPFRAKVSGALRAGGTTVQVDGCLPGPAGQGRSGGGGCCGGGCGGC